jgi:hypothetical protein
VIVVVDASVLVAELLRRRGRELFAHPDLQCVVAEEQWEEALHELQKRVAAIVGQGRLSSEQGEKLLGVVHDFVEDDVIEVVPRMFYEHMERAARRRGAPRPQRLGIGRPCPHPQRRDPDGRPRLPRLRLSHVDGRDADDRARISLTARTGRLWVPNIRSPS